MRAIRLAASTLALSLMAAPALASPFCVQLTGIPDQCFYADPNECQHEADRQGGRCSANPTEFQTTRATGTAQFCIVESGNVATCIFSDMASCESERRQRGGACITSTQSPASPPSVDPYALKRNY